MKVYSGGQSRELEQSLLDLKNDFSFEIHFCTSGFRLEVPNHCKKHRGKRGRFPAASEGKARSEGIQIAKEKFLTLEVCDSRIAFQINHPADVALLL